MFLFVVMLLLAAPQRTVVNAFTPCDVEDDEGEEVDAAAATAEEQEALANILCIVVVVAVVVCVRVLPRECREGGRRGRGTRESLELFAAPQNKILRSARFICDNKKRFSRFGERVIFRSARGTLGSPRNTYRES